MSPIQLTKQATPGAAPASKIVIYADTSDGIVKAMDSSGVSQNMSASAMDFTWTLQYDNGAVAIDSGITFIPFRSGFAATIKGVELRANTIGRVQVDVRRAVFNSITEPMHQSFTVVPTVKPNFNSTISAQFNSLADGTVSVLKTDYIQVVINTCVNIPRLMVAINGTRT